MKVALVHDYLTEYGGAERVLEAMHEIYPQAPIYTAIYDQKRITYHVSRIASWNIRTPAWTKNPLIEKFPKYFTFLLPLVFENFDLKDFDVIISSTANFAKGVLTTPKQLHICYCHTPPRFLYHFKTETKKRDKWYFKGLLSPLDNYLRIWDNIASQRVDFFIANSKNTARRIWKFYHKKAEVIYPPVSVGQSVSRTARQWGSEAVGQQEEKTAKLTNRQTDYFLIVSRLAAYKNIDLAILACNKLKLPLKVVGVGREEKRLKRIAEGTVEFLGFVSDEELADLYSNCQAVIFPTGDEEFGIVPVEAQMFGKQVIALRSGGVLETIVPGVTGEFFDKPTVESLVSVLRRFDTLKYHSQDCIKNAKKFSKERFQEEFEAFVENKWMEHQSRMRV